MTKNNFDYYNHIYKSIHKRVYIWKFTTDGSDRDEWTHDYTIELISKLYLVSPDKQGPKANPDNLINNWAIFMVKVWQLRDLKKLKKKDEDYNEEDYDLLISDHLITNNMLLDVKILIENDPEFTLEEKLLYNLSYIQDGSIRISAGKMGKSKTVVGEIHKNLIRKLKKYKNYI